MPVTREDFLSTSPQETKDLAADLVDSLSTLSVITLKGELGAGKTTFAQGFGESFGIRRMTSPTYNIIKEYPITDNPRYLNLHHIDLYNVDTVQKALDLGLEELWKDSRNILLIEWPDIISDVLPKHIEVVIRSQEGDERQLTIFRQVWSCI